MRARLPVAATAVAAATGLLLAACGAPGAAQQVTNAGAAFTAADAASYHPARTTTPIQHVVVIFGENISFDHYFGTYPNATNADGTPFTAARHTPKVNGLSKKLLTDNPNAYNPKRLAPSQALTCDQNHGYGPEQKAVNGGKMDKFVENTETDKCTGQPVLFGEPGLVMDYYDGNTVTGLWNYAQHYAMSDNSFDTVYGPSTPGALNLISGQTHGGQAVDPKTGTPTTDAYAVQSPDANGIGTITNDPDPYYDDCSNNNGKSTNNLAVMHGQNVGDLLNQRNVTWGWFQGGFKPTGTANGKAVCGASHPNVGGIAANDYSPHHEPFEYYKSTANPKHLPPSSVAAIGHTDQANHQYDTSDFDAARGGEQPAGGQLPEGRRVPGRPRRVLRSAGRAGVRRQGAQPAAEVEGVVVDCGCPGVRRLRRLVRPREVPDGERLSRTRRSTSRQRVARLRCPAGTPTAAVTVRGCRCWWSRRTRRTTTSTTR